MPGQPVDPLPGLRAEVTQLQGQVKELQARDQQLTEALQCILEAIRPQYGTPPDRKDPSTDAFRRAARLVGR